MRWLRVVGFVWVSFEIVMFLAFQTFPINFNEYPSITTDPRAVLMNSGVIFGFGILYFYSGFAVVHDRLISLHKQNLLMFVIKKYLTTAFSIGYVTALIATILPFLGDDAPLYPQIMSSLFSDNCAQYWWTNILMISNFYPWNSALLCGAHIPYLVTDFQLIAFLTPFFLLLRPHPLLLTPFLILLTSVCIGITVYMVLQGNVSGFPGHQTEGYELLMFRLYYRVTPFVMGAVVAMVNFRMKQKGSGVDKTGRKVMEWARKHRNIFKYVFCYLIGVLLLLFPVLILLTDTRCVDPSPVHSSASFALTYCWPPLLVALYHSLSTPLFLLGLLLLLLPSLLHQSSYLTPLLSSHLWHILEELTPTAFLLQFPVVAWYYASRDTNSFITQTAIIMVTLSSVVVSYGLAVPFYLMAERPFRGFIDLILFPKSSIFKRQKDLDDEESEEDDTEEEDKKMANKNKIMAKEL